MKKFALFAIMTLLSCFNSFLSRAEDSAPVRINASQTPLIQPASIDDREIYECWVKEKQIALGVHKSCTEFDVMREVRNAIAESSLDANTKNALLTALDKKLFMLEKRAVERKNSLALYRKQQRDDVFLILGIMFPALFGIVLIAGLASKH